MISKIASDFSFEPYNLYWLSLLVLTSVQAILAVVGTNVFQKRHHHLLRLANDIPVRLQLAFLSFCLAIFINAGFSDERRSLAVLNGILLVVAFTAFILGIKRASQAHFNDALEKAKHTCPDRADEECTSSLGWWMRTKLVSFNVVTYFACLTLAIILVFSLRPKVTSALAVNRQKTSGAVMVRSIPYKDQPDWYSDHFYWLEKEGDREKYAKMIADYQLGEGQYVAPFYTIPSTISIRVPEGYTVVSRAAFRIGNVDSRVLFERLEPESSDQTLREVKVSVPECNKDDKILVLFRVDSKRSGASVSVEDIVRTSID